MTSAARGALPNGLIEEKGSALTAATTAGDRYKQLIEAVLDALEYFEQREDADMPEADGRWVPNEEMKQAMALRKALEDLGVKVDD